MKEITLLDCYTDEPSGLGVPPYLGVYPRYIAGYFISKGYKVNYMTIDDLRKNYFPISKSKKTDIKKYNFSINSALSGKVYAIIGVHVPGKYLSAVPGTIRELKLMKQTDLTLTGPGIYGNQLEGGKVSEDDFGFNKEHIEFSFKDIKEYSLLGAQIIKQIKDIRIIEIETGRGCNVGKCIFCTEPIKNKFENRPLKDILDEIGEFYRLGCRYFRIGKQADFYAYDKNIELLRSINELFPDIKVLHIDNVNPNSVIRNDEITKAIVKYCTSGNIAAFGVESFDLDVVKKSLLNTTPLTAYNAIKILNELGSKYGNNGMPKFLPGINIILGLAGESKKTFQINYEFLKKIYDEGFMLRRINIRQMAVFSGTKMKEYGTKFVKKNKKYYFSFREKIRNEIDMPLLERMLPLGHILRDVRIEIHDGNTSFGRQLGTYPIIIGIKEKLEIGKFYNIKITGHMLRSVTGEII